ncbi:MAG: hypothetical protein U0176_04870 [Bacteroidia bacterium]
MPSLEVVVLDTLSPFLDLQTLAVKSSSHAMYTEILPGNVLKFTFRDIHLPDSTTNEPASHGYLTYEIKAAQGLNPEFEVRNGSAIYFDFNPPILTNFTLNTGGIHPDLHRGHAGNRRAHRNRPFPQSGDASRESAIREVSG